MWRIFYGYNNGALTLNNDPVLFGKCSPSTYKGVNIIGVILYYIDDNNDIKGASFAISFAKHIDINKFIINNTVFDITNSHKDNDSTQSCSYMYDITINNGDLVKYFRDNDGKQITITLE